MRNGLIGVNMTFLNVVCKVSEIQRGQLWVSVEAMLAETILREALMQSALSTFKPTLNLASRSCILALVTFTRRFADT